MARRVGEIPTTHYHRRRRELLARLERVNRAIDRWDEIESARSKGWARMVPSQPSLSREALKELALMLCGLLAELEQARERRN